MEEGLAASGAQTNNELIAEVVRLLMEGVDPQALIDQGVPPEVLQQAMEIVMSQAPAGGAPTEQMAQSPVTEGGLAASAMA